MFDLNDAYKPISIEDIVSKVSEYQIWKTYCKNFEEIDKSFLSELYDDNRPSCRIFIAPDNVLLYKDFGTGLCCNWYRYIQIKYNCTFKEALSIVANDFGLTGNKVDIKPSIAIGQPNLKPKVRDKAFIEIVSQAWTLTDYNYWSQYCIPLSLLDSYNVFSCKHLYLHKGDNVTIFNYNNKNPIYAYRFDSEKGSTYKGYFPFAQNPYRFLYGGTTTDVEGFNQLPDNGELLIITKSLKDVMCYNLLDIPAISLQGEAQKLPKELVDKLLKRFNKIIINYDNDDQGMISTEKLTKEFGFDYYYIDNAKDLSDYIKEYGLTKAKELIDGKIREKESIKSFIGK